MTPQTSSNPEEKIYESWDCPQVEAIQSYRAQDEDEINVARGDTANVLRKLSDSGTATLVAIPTMGTHQTTLLCT